MKDSYVYQTQKDECHLKAKRSALVALHGLSAKQDHSAHCHQPEAQTCPREHVIHEIRYRRRSNAPFQQSQIEEQDGSEEQSQSQYVSDDQQAKPKI